jgi:type IV pilus assembly protein PilW
MTLIELMVAMLIGLLLTLAMVSALVYGEAQKRTTNTTSDMDQSGAYAANILDTALRNAGSGLMQTLKPVNIGIIGCNPGFTGVLPDPFGSFLGGNIGTLRVAPVLIAANPSGATDPPGSDVLAVMSGSGAAGGLPRAVAVATGNTLTLDNTVGIVSNPGSIGTDKPQALLNQPSMVGDFCSIQTITAFDPTAHTLTLDAIPAQPPSVVLPLGNRTAGDVQFQLLGVNPATNTLTRYDLLAQGAAQPMAANVMALYAIYGIADAAGRLNAWVAPTAASGWDAGTLLGNPANFSQIVAIRIALILKSSLYEKDEVSAGKPLTWFNTGQDGIAVTGLTAGANTWTPAAGSADAHYRYRVMEFVVPVRNEVIVNN